MSSPNRDTIDLSKPLTIYIDRPGGGLFNMSADHYLLESGPTPCLRLYRWARPTLSLGYRQRTDWLNTDLEVVRRPSGGRALLHHDELTYCLVVECERRPHLPSAYRKLTGLLALALSHLGVEVELAEKTRLAPSRTHPGCMSITAGGEILFGGQKLVGSAQVSRRLRLLQHGVIPFSFDRALLASVLPSEGELRGLVELGGPRFEAEELARALLEANGLRGHLSDWTATQRAEIEGGLDEWRSTR